MWPARPDRSTPDRRAVAPGGELADDCEAFLAGRYAERLLAQTRRVPAWAWLNQAAHADADTIMAAAGHLPADGAVLLWSDARACVAVLVAAALAWGADLRELQQDVLIPLELTLRDSPITPEGLTKLVCQALV